MLPTWMSIPAMTTLLNSGVASPDIFSSALAAFQVSDGLGDKAIVAIISSVIGSAMAIAILRTKFAALAELVEKISKSVEANAKDISKVSVETTERISQISTDRMGCELRSSREYATRGELIRQNLDTRSSIESFRKDIDDSLRHLHERVDVINKATAAIEATLKSKEKAQG